MELFIYGTSYVGPHKILACMFMLLRRHVCHLHIQRLRIRLSVLCILYVLLVYIAWLFYAFAKDMLAYTKQINAYWASIDLSLAVPSRL